MLILFSQGSFNSDNSQWNINFENKIELCPKKSVSSLITNFNLSNTTFMQSPNSNPASYTWLYNSTELDPNDPNNCMRLSFTWVDESFVPIQAGDVKIIITHYRNLNGEGKILPTYELSFMNVSLIENSIISGQYYINLDPMNMNNDPVSGNISRGFHTFNITCNKVGYDPLIYSGNFSILITTLLTITTPSHTSIPSSGSNYIHHYSEQMTAGESYNFKLFYEVKRNDANHEYFTNIGGNYYQNKVNIKYELKNIRKFTNFYEIQNLMDFVNETFFYSTIGEWDNKTRSATWPSKGYMKSDFDGSFYASLEWPSLTNPMYSLDDYTIQMNGPGYEMIYEYQIDASVSVNRSGLGTYDFQPNDIQIQITEGMKDNNTMTYSDEVKKTEESMFLKLQPTHVYLPDAPVLDPISPSYSSTGNITLDWSDSYMVVGYMVYRDVSPITIINQLSPIAYPMVSNYMDTDLSSGIYYYAIVSSNLSGESGISNVQSVTVDKIIPTNPTFTDQIIGTTNSDVWQNQVDSPSFTWSGASDGSGSGIKGYYVYFGTSPTGTSENFIATNSFNPGTITTGTYYLRVMTTDNADNNASSWVTLYIFKYGEEPILNKTGNLEIIIPAQFQISTLTIKSAITENITFTLNYTDENHQPFASYADLIMGIQVDGNVSTISQINPLGNSLFECIIIPSDNGFGVGVHTITVSVEKPGYNLEMKNINSQLIEAWATEFSVMLAPSSQPKGNIIQYILYYECNEFPRSGQPLYDAQITQIIILQNGTQQAVLSTPELMISWGWANLQSNGSYGPGYYEIWIDTSILSIDTAKLFQFYTNIVAENYEPSIVSCYALLRPVEMTITPMIPGYPGVPVTALTYSIYSANVKMNALINVTDVDSIYYGNLISTANVLFKIYNSTNMGLLSFGLMVLIAPGLFEMDLVTSLIGNFTVEINATNSGYLSTNTYFTYEIVENIINPTPTAPILGPIEPNPSSTGNIILDWNDVSGATSYFVYRDTTTISSVIGKTPIANPTVSTYTDGGRPNGTYYYAIIANNASGNSSLSNCINVTVAIPPPTQDIPIAPSIQVITPNPSSTGNITINWNQVNGATRYYLYRDSTTITTTAGLTPIANITTNTYQDFGLVNGTYHYAVIASNTSGNSTISNIRTVTVAIPPSPTYTPAVPTLSMIIPNPSTTGNITLSWTAVPGATQYRVYRDGTPISGIEGKTPIATIHGTTYLDGGLSNGTYYYVIVAENATGHSPISNGESVTVAIPPITNPSSNSTTSNSTTTSSTTPPPSNPFRVDSYTPTFMCWMIIVGIAALLRITRKTLTHV
jgi:hypothetical protein